MSIRPLAVALLSALLLSAITIAPAAGARPSTPQPPDERPLTAEEQAASDGKVAAAEAYVAAAEAEGVDLVTLSCVSPTGASTDAITASCYVPSGYLSVQARDQTKGHYCGPAVGQVIANYSWAMRSGTNKYSQAKIAGWMLTDLNGMTNAPELRTGLEKATAASPRLPARWAWVVTNLSDTDRDGAVGDQLQTYVRSNISGSKMPLAIAVKPYDRNSRFHLSSWARPVSSPGHWIAAYGWYGNWTGTDFARIYYTDSSKDEGGSTGKFWDPTRHIAAMIMEHTRRFVW